MNGGKPVTMSIEAQSPIYPVLTQPGSRLGPPPGAFPENGVSVRVLRDTKEDAEFAAKLTVEAFRGKYVHTITERKYVYMLIFRYTMLIIE
jgi:hypothetical protein